MAILKSEIVGVTISTLLINRIKDIPGSRKSHCKWKLLPTEHLDFLSKCTLRYINSYGATYRIDPNHELMLKHTTNGKSYSLESYGELFNMIITDYDDDIQETNNLRDYVISINERPHETRLQLRRHLELLGEKLHVSSAAWCSDCSFDQLFFDSDSEWSCSNSRKSNKNFIPISIEDFIAKFSLPSQEQPMSTSQDIKVGSHWERFDSPDGEIVTVEEITGNFVHFNRNRDRSIEEFLERFKPRPDLDTPADNTNASCEFSIGDLICYNQDARNKLGSAKGTLPNEIIGNVTNVIDRSIPGSTPLLEYKTIHGKLDTIDSGWVTKYVATPGKVKSTKPKSKPVAQPEPIQSITKEKPMAQKPTIRDTAVTLATANKDAAILAAKLEAGKILNKQVIKLIKPKLPLMVRGYADSPLASVVLANVVGFAIKQYAGDNAKAGQLAEMMLQASAVESISALNIDSLIDELLSSVKLPKAVRAELNGLDDDYE